MQGNDPHTEPGKRPHPLQRVLAAYEYYEQIVAVVLSILIALVVAVALVELVRIVLYMLENEVLNPLQPETFQLVFGMIMLVLIALEFKHSILKVALRNDSIVQVRTVILIALLALARKFVILDVNSSPAQIAALALALLALGVVYGIVRKRESGPSFGTQPDGQAERSGQWPSPGERPAAGGTQADTSGPRPR